MLLLVQKNSVKERKKKKVIKGVRGLFVILDKNYYGVRPDIYYVSNSLCKPATNMNVPYKEEGTLESECL